MSQRRDDFAELRRLLAVKRHERPPPGYFDHFSDRVIRRLEDDGEVEENSQWQQFLRLLSAKPVLACFYGGFVAAVLLVGFKISEGMTPEPALRQTEALPWLASFDESNLVFPASPATVLPPAPFAMMRGAPRANGATLSARGNELGVEPVTFTTWIRP